jgi:hypothetical protein
MRLPIWGAFIAITLLTGCFAPVAQREAQEIARKQVTRYCRGTCEPLTLGRIQRIKDRWLIDLDSPARKFTVTVETDGNYKVDAWDKSLAR